MSNGNCTCTVPPTDIWATSGQVFNTDIGSPYYVVIVCGILLGMIGFQVVLMRYDKNASLRLSDYVGFVLFGSLSDYVVYLFAIMFDVQNVWMLIAIFLSLTVTRSINAIAARNRALLRANNVDPPTADLLLAIRAAIAKTTLDTDDDDDDDADDADDADDDRGDRADVVVGARVMHAYGRVAHSRRAVPPRTSPALACCRCLYPSAVRAHANVGNQQRTTAGRADLQVDVVTNARPVSGVGERTVTLTFRRVSCA